MMNVPAFLRSVARFLIPAVALVALITLVACSDAPEESKGWSFPEDLEKFKTFEGVKPGEVSLKDCQSALCAEVRTAEREAFVTGCLAASPAPLQGDMQKLCLCAADDYVSANSLQTLMAAYESRNYDNIAMPNIEQCYVEAFFQ